MLQSLVDHLVCAVDEHPLTITAAQAAQIPTVQRLAREIWHTHYPSIIDVAQIDYMLDRGYSHEALLRFVEARDAGLALAGTPDGVIGFAAWYRVDATASKLDKLYVLPQRHRAGIGRALIEHVVGHAEAAGSKSLTLNVNRGNTMAIRAYERCGFTIRARGDFPIGGGFVMEDFIMVREL
jgi:ribosomal protein S18 acetylase RimI-like enzyme